TLPSPPRGEGKKNAPSPLGGEGKKNAPSPLGGEGKKNAPSPLGGEGRVRGWSLKRLHRLIVTSATYRQSSRLTPELLRRDPDNRLLARGPRIRVEREVVRDVALAASG